MHHRQVGHRREQASGIVRASLMATLVLVHPPRMGFGPRHGRRWCDRLVADATGHLTFPQRSDALKHIIGLPPQCLSALLVKAALLAQVLEHIGRRADLALDLRAA
jgi:hypothetical protein